MRRNKIIRSLVLIMLAACSVQVSAQKSWPCKTWKVIAEDGKYGYIDPDGKVMIKPQWQYAGRFSEGLAIVCTTPNGKNPSMLNLGDRTVSFEFGNKTSYGVIDSTGTYIVTPRNNFEIWRSYQNGIAVVRITGKNHFLDKKGKLIGHYDKQYDQAYKDFIYPQQAGSGHLKGYCNGYGQTVIPHMFTGVENFSGDRAVVLIYNRYGYINRKGAIVIEPMFDRANDFSEGYAVVKVVENSGNTQRELYGVIDTLGNFIIEPKWDFISKYSEGLFCVGIKGGKEGVRYGYVDASGKTIIPIEYESAEVFSEGLAGAKKDGEMGYINMKGEWVIKPKYKYAGRFMDGTALIVLDNGKEGYIDKEGKYIWEPIHMWGGN